jgi:hypothetical protein
VEPRGANQAARTPEPGVDTDHRCCPALAAAGPWRLDRPTPMSWLTSRGLARPPLTLRSTGETAAHCPVATGARCAAKCGRGRSAGSSTRVRGPGRRALGGVCSEVRASGPRLVRCRADLRSLTNPPHLQPHQRCPSTPRDPIDIRRGRRGEDPRTGCSLPDPSAAPDEPTRPRYAG